jgi:hypothetical protein
VAESAVIELLGLVWAHNREATGHSWLKLNHSMREALSLALHTGMLFAADDFCTMAERFRLSYWSGDLELFYREAVLYRNASAWQAYEAFVKRRPFIFKGASCYAHTGDGPCGTGLARLVVGAEFQWNGERVTVTSFDDYGQCLTACSYRRTENEKCPRCEHCCICGKSGVTRILRRYRITHADLRSAKQKAGKRPQCPEVASHA